MDTKPKTVAGLFIITCLLFLSFQEVSTASSPWTDQEQILFEYSGHQGLVIKPKQAAEGNPWVWIASDFDANPLTEALLTHGLHLAWIDVDTLWGNEEALATADAFYNWAVEEQQFAAKPVLLSSDIGTWLLFNWASQHPEQVSAIYAMNPWLIPNLKEEEVEDPAYMNALAAHGLDKTTEADAFFALPSNRAESLSKSMVPVMLALIGWDKVMKEAADSFYKSYRLAGKGFFEIMAPPPDRTSASPGVLLHTLFFILERSGVLADSTENQSLPNAPNWAVADFSGSGGVCVLDDAILMKAGNEMTGIKWQGDLPEGDYEITLDAMRVSGNDFFCGLTVPKQDTSFSLVVGGWGGTCIGISCLDWADAYNNETAVFRGLQSHRWYPIKLRVVGDQIQAWVDNEQVVDVDVSNREVDIRWEMEPTKPLGIATWCTTGAIRNFRITPVSEF